MSAANATPVKIFRSLAKNGDIYGDIAYDSSMIYRDMTLFGYDIITAVKLAVDRAASTWVTEFFQGMVGTLSSGGNLKLYFLNRAEHYMRENRIRLTQFLEHLQCLLKHTLLLQSQCLFPHRHARNYVLGLWRRLSDFREYGLWHCNGTSTNDPCRIFPLRVADVTRTGDVNRRGMRWRRRRTVRRKSR